MLPWWLHLLGLGQRQARVTLPGGTLAIDWRDDNHVFMTGPAQRTFVGQTELDQLEDGAAAPDQAAATDQGAPDQAAPDQGATVDTEAAAYEQTMSFLANTSLDEMLELAANSLAQRTQRRGRPPVTPPGGPVPDWDHRGH